MALDASRFDVRLSLPVEVVARDGDWTKVRGHVSDETFRTAPYLPFDFEAWTNAEISGESQFGMIGLLRNSAVPPSHRAGAALTLFDRPGRDARAVAKAAVGAPLRTGRSSGGYVAIKLDGVSAANEYSEFWVEEAALSTKASSW